MNPRRALLALFAGLAAFVVASQVRASEPDPVPQAAASAVASALPTRAPSGAPSSAPSGAAPVAPPGFSLPALLGAGGAPQPYAQFVKKTERQSGLIDLIKKDDDVFLDLGPEQFDRTYIVAPVLASGVGAEAFAGRVYPTFLLTFKRVGKRVLWIDENADFSAPQGTSAASALAISVTDSVINSTPVVAEDEQTKRVVVSAAFFLGDFENVGRDLGGGAPGPLVLLGAATHGGFSVDAAKSYVERTKTLPKNDEILANLAFSGPAGDLSGAPDGRGVRLRMHYSIVEAPQASSYLPRLADDRVGYFVTAQKRFDNDALPTPFVRYIDRWNFKNGPIVYYLTNEIPAQYKRPIRAALLAWNAAFAKAGVPNAIEVRDQPNDPAWDPDDIRYSTVRWITSDRSPFAAYGPSIVDPRTGEILRVEIVVDGEALRSIKRGFVDQVVPTRAATTAYGLPAGSAGLSLRCDDPGACDTFDADSAALASVGTVALRASGATPAQTERFAEDWLQMAVMHESGHNFGLRHNFVSATLYSLQQIHDRSFTRAHGLVGSVMGYTPLNLSPPGKPQGDYFQLRLGPYDYWAIRYGYEALPNVRRPDDERIALRGIASESTLRKYAYATDEDAGGPLAIDPRVAAFQLSSDPLAFDANQFAVIDDLVTNLDRRYPRDDRPYYEERRTFETLMSAYERAAMLATKYVGGTYTSRDHRGQAGGSAPIRPVSREDARRAFTLLAQHVFSDRALRFSPQLLADLGPEHFLHRGVDNVEPPDFPLEEYVAGLQDNVLFAVFSPDAMTRIADDGYKVAPGTKLMTLDDLFGWTQAAVWDDLRAGAPIDALHRGLQRRYTNLMIAFSLAPSFLISALGYPSDAPPLARYELRRLAASVGAALRSPRLDVATRAHLEDVQSRVERALQPNATRGA